MGRLIEITDISAGELDVFSRLTQAQLRSRREPEKGIFIAESYNVITQALKYGCEPISFLMERRHIEGQGAELIRNRDVPVYTADREVLAELTGYELTRGFLCAMKRPKPGNMDEICRDCHRIAVLEGIVDASNVGAIFRSAAAMHMDGVLLDQTCCDPLSRRALRVSMGAVFQIPWARIPEAWPREGINSLQNMGFKTAALALTDRSVSIEDPGLCGEEKLAVILGTEGSGLKQETIDCCDYTVKIPMSHGVDSLNVAAAAAVAFWQLRLR